MGPPCPPCLRGFLAFWERAVVAESDKSCSQPLPQALAGHDRSRRRGCRVFGGRPRPPQDRAPANEPASLRRRARVGAASKEQQPLSRVIGAVARRWGGLFSEIGPVARRWGGLSRAIEAVVSRLRGLSSKIAPKARRPHLLPKAVRMQQRTGALSRPWRANIRPLEQGVHRLPTWESSDG